MSLSKPLVSALILLVLGLHLGADAARAVGFSQWLGSRSWPVQAYGMYKESFSNRVISATRYRMIGVTERGSDLEIGLGTGGMERKALIDHFIEPMLEGDRSVAGHLADRVNQGREDPIVAFRLEGERVEIAEPGPVREKFPPVTFVFGQQGLPR